MANKPTGMLMDGVFASEAIDSSGEIVSISGMDIHTMEEGQGVANYEHLGEDGNYGREIVGKIIYVKKILKESDCENDRQRSYWTKLKGIAFLYGVVRLYDGAGHEGAKALAAQVRDHVANDEPILVRYSIEGTTTKKVENKIEQSIAKKVALTLKPCNKTAISGLVSDPNAPDGFPSVQKAEAHFIDPEFAPLGGTIAMECNPLIDAKEEATVRLLAAAATLKAVRKALTAGSTDAAPSSLTGGAALQREDHIRSTAKACIRDWGDKPFRRSEFKAFAKTKLPEVSDEFLDHFSDIAEAYTVKKDLKKSLPKVKAEVARASGDTGAWAAKPKSPARIKPDVAAAPKHVATPNISAATEPRHAVISDLSDAEEHAPEEIIQSGGEGTGKRISNGTYRGKVIPNNPGMVRPEFDAKKGILHTPIGSFRAYLPQHDGPEAAANYQRILSHPDVEGAMDHAMTNWSKVHKLLKAGKLPPEVVMHAVMFAQLSPTKPVPTQEIQFARLVDAMDATGIDPRHPNFHEIDQPYRNLDRPDVLPHTAREAFKTNPAYYQGGQIGVQHDAAGNPIGEPSAETGRRPGELLSTSPLWNDFLSRASQYHKLHEPLMQLAQTHKHDVMGAISSLMDSKRARDNYKNVRRAAIKAGKPDPGAYQGLEVPGLKVKTGLYTWGMMGGGNSVVPDTHFIRNAYGLDLNKDKDTISYLKQLHWRPTNMQRVMSPFNDWYHDNHPALQYTVNHPKWGSTFENSRDALFPAFWRHWLTIAPHERFLGLPNESQQARTDHAPFWEAIAPHVDPLVKTDGVEDSSVPLRTALVHQQYVKDYGEIPAMFLFYHHLVPQLLASHEAKKRLGSDMSFLTKARQLEAGLIELRKSVSDALAGIHAEAPEVHKVDLQMGDRTHPAGRFVITPDHHLKHLEDYHGILASMLPEGPVDATTISRLHGMKWSPHIAVSPHDAPTPASMQPPPAATLQVAEAMPPPPPPVFEYHRPGMTKPHILEFGGSGAALDGQKLGDAELGLMLSNVKGGMATLRYRKTAPAQTEDLTKALPGEEDIDFQGGVSPHVKQLMKPGDALQHIRAAVAAGHIHPDIERALTKHIYEDPMAVGVGNKYAWEEFKAKKKPGVYVSMDGNDFKHINDTHGHQAGDDAIRGIGSSLRAAADKVGTGKLFRAGGDEFVAHFPSFEEASKFARHATKNLDSIPPVASSRGVSKLSMSMGFGTDYGTADKALMMAKQGKVDPVTKGRAFAPGQTPHFAHSLVPGTEGAIPMHHTGVPAKALPAKAASATVPTPS